MAELPSGTVTFLFTDIEDSARLWEEHPEEMQLALARHDEVVRAAIESCSGYMVKTTGDGAHAVFATAADAVTAAVGAQRALLAERWPAPVELRVRMGLHTGETQERDGDYFGPPVNRAARVMAASHGGQIILTSVTRDVLGARSGLELHDLGTHQLRGVNGPLHLFGVSTEGVPWSDRALATATPPPRGNLPRVASDWFGSAADLQRHAEEVARRSLVTLTGSGGVGKTRTALEIAWLADAEFPAGAWLVELGPVADPDAVMDAVASTMAIGPQPGMSTLEAIVDWLRDRRLLLVLDNCEHVVAPVAELVAAITARVETVSVLATSREPLGVAGERVVVVPSLPIGDAIELFCERARAADDTVEFDAKELDAVEEICRRLDGIPLALELAAARVRTLAPTELLPRLDARFRLLRGAGRGGLERHQTLRATVEWSYRLLSETEQLLFDRISVFAGTFDLAAAEAVCTDDGIEDVDVVDRLASLVDKSMLVADRTDIGTRYRLLETLRQFGEEHADGRGETARLRDRHAAHYVDAARRADRRRAGLSQFDAEQLLAADWDNLRAAHDWTITSRDLDAAQAIVAATGPHARAWMRDEQGSWASRCIEELGAASTAWPSTYGWAAYWRSIASVHGTDDREEVARLARQGIAAADDEDHPDTALCWPLLILSGAFTDPSEAAAALEHATVSGRANPDPFIRVWALNVRFQFARWSSRREAEAIVRETRQLAEEVGAPTLWATAWIFANTLGATADPPDQAALDAARAGLEQARRAGDRLWEGLCLSAYAITASLFDAPDAIAALGEALRHFVDTRNWAHLNEPLDEVVERRDDLAPVIIGWLEHSGVPYVGYYRPRPLAPLVEECRRSPHGVDGMARGAAMDRDELVAYVLDHLEPA